MYALAFGLGMVTVVDNPTRQAFATEMVGRDGLANAIALNSAVFNLARIVGPAVAGLVISLLGTPAAFLVNAASYGAVLISLKLMRPSELNVVERVPRAKGQLREAMRYVRERPALWMTHGADLLRGHVRHELPGDQRADVPPGVPHRGRPRSASRPRCSPSGRWAGRCSPPAAPGRR